MATFVDNSETTTLLQQTLGRLRALIRGYVVSQGVAVIIVWHCVTFWCALGLDYLPVRMGLTDLPRWPRVVLLSTILAGTVYLFLRYILQRLLAKLDDQSLALLVERRHAEFQDAFVTAIEFDPTRSKDRECDASMVERARQQAIEKARHFRTSSVLNTTPLWIAAISAALLMISVTAFARLAPKAFEVGFRRLYLLDAQPWPRLTQLTNLGATLTPAYELKGIPDSLYRPQFEDDGLKVGVGTTLDIWVRAAAPSDDAPDRILPPSCSLRFRSVDGDRGRVTLDAEGSQIRGQQSYRYAGKPFEGVLSDLRIDVRGGDARLTQQRIEVVENPTLITTELDCSFPDYMVDWDSGAWTPRTIELPTNSNIPFGTRAVLRGESNKRLSRAFVHHVLSDRHYELDLSGSDVDATAFEIDLSELTESEVIDIALLDRDGVLSANKFTIELNVVDDRPPEVTTRLEGIGAVVTPRVRIPIKGKIQDDYGIEEAWIEVLVTEQDPFVAAVQLNAGNEFSEEIDFESLRRDNEIRWDLVPDSGQMIQLTTRAVDRYNLELSETDDSDEGRIRVNSLNQQTGSAESIELRVVSETELLRILERAEVGQRKRLEQIFAEMGEAQLHCLRTRIALSDANPVDGGQDVLPQTPQDDTNGISDAELKPLLAQRARMQSEKSWRELGGVVQSFDDIRAQLENNRVDAEDRKRRLKGSVSEPLQALLDSDYPRLIEQLEELESKLADYHAAGEEPAQAIEVNLLADETIDHCQRIRDTLQTVLTKLAKYESYGELLDLFREVIREQEALIEQTENERKRQGLDDLFGR